jgi:hypothetical protein
MKSKSSNQSNFNSLNISINMTISNNHNDIMVNEKNNIVKYIIFKFYNNFIKNSIILSTILIFITTYFMNSQLLKNPIKEKSLILHGKIVDEFNNPIKNIKIVVNNSNPVYSDSYEGNFIIKDFFLGNEKIAIFYIGDKNPEKIIMNFETYKIENDKIDLLDAIKIKKRNN